MSYQALPPVNLESEVVGVLPIANGGTNQATALNNNRICISSGGEFVETAAITANRVIISNASGIPIHNAALTQNRVVTADASGLPTSAAAITASRALVSDSNGLPVASSITTAQINTTLYWTKYSVTHTQFQTNATSNNIELFVLAAKSAIHRVIIKPTIEFAGTLTYTLSVGITGSLAKFIAAYNVMQTVTDIEYGISGTGINTSVENFGSTTSIRINAVSTVVNLDQSTAGAADIYVLTSTLP